MVVGDGDDVVGDGRDLLPVVIPVLVVFLLPPRLSAFVLAFLDAAAPPTAADFEVPFMPVLLLLRGSRNVFSPRCGSFVSKKTNCLLPPDPKAADDGERSLLLLLPPPKNDSLDGDDVGDGVVDLKNLLRNGEDNSPDVAAPNVVPPVLEPVPDMNPGPNSVGREAVVSVPTSESGDVEDGNEVVIVVASFFSFVGDGFTVVAADENAFRAVAVVFPSPDDCDGDGDGERNRGMLLS